MDKHILIVDDSRTCQIIARESVKTMGSIEIVDNCAKARNICAVKKFDLLIIDLFLPDGNGIELFSELKLLPHCRQSRAIIVTAEEDISKKIAAFSIGADDYLVKPYVKLELRARAERLFSREESETTFCDSSSRICLNSLSYKAYVEVEDSAEDLNLTPHEFKILNVLIRNPERIYTRDILINLVWGVNTFISERTVDTHISTLRKKLGAASKLLCCIRGEGYKWIEKASQGGTPKGFKEAS